MGKKILLLRWLPKSEIRQYAQATGLDEYDFEVITQYNDPRILPALQKSIGDGQYVGCILGDWYDLGKAISKICTSFNVPTSEVRFGNINWARAFRELAEKVPARELATATSTWGIDRSMPPEPD